MATLEEQKEYIRTNYKKLTGQFMAKMLGIRPEKVYALVKELGLKKQRPPPVIKPIMTSNMLCKVRVKVGL